MAKDLTILVSSPMWACSQVVPFALIELAAYMEMRDLPVELLDVKRSPYSRPSRGLFENVANDILGKLERRKPLHVGLSCFTGDYWYCRKLAEKIKERIQTTIIVGSVHATLKPEDFFYPQSPFDIAVIGEGEETLCEIVNRRDSGMNLEDIKGIAFVKEGKLIRTPPRLSFRNLANLPRPSYHLLDIEYYLQPQRGVVRALVISGLHILTGRGCPYSCTFCANKTIFESQGLKPVVRHRVIPQVIDTLKWLKNTYNLESFYISDDTFTLPPSRAIEFCRQYQLSELDMVWAAETRVNLLDEELVEEMKRARCVQLDFGVESGSQAVLTRMKKGITVAETHRAFSLCKKHKLRKYANIMFNTPGETAEDVKLTIQLMKKIKADHYGIALTVPLPGSQLFDQYIGRDNLSKDEYRIFSTPGLFQKIVDPRLRLASHTLNLNRLYIMVNLRFFLINSFIELTFAKWYWKTFFKSKRKLGYLKCYFLSFLKQIRKYTGSVLKS